VTRDPFGGECSPANCSPDQPSRIGGTVGGDEGATEAGLDATGSTGGEDASAADASSTALEAAAGADAGSQDGVADAVTDDLVTVEPLDGNVDEESGPEGADDADGGLPAVDGDVDPPSFTVIKQVNQPGISCRGVGSLKATYGNAGEALNNTSSAGEILCAVRRSAGSDFAEVADVPRLFVLDRSATEDVCCKLQSKGPQSGTIETPTFCTSMASNDNQLMALPALYDPDPWSQLSILCTVPALTVAGASGILTYRVRQGKMPGTASNGEED
jgi:hypothetical protein